MTTDSSMIVLTFWCFIGLHSWMNGVAGMILHVQHQDLRQTAQLSTFVSQMRKTVEVQRRVSFRT